MLSVGDLQKSDLLRALLRDYEKDVEPPVTSGNTTVEMTLSVECATIIDDFVSVESETGMVSAALVIIIIVYYARSST